MADWKYKVRLRDLHERYESGELTVREVGVELAARLRASGAWHDDDRGWRDELRHIAEELREEVEDVQDYDRILNDLYDLGDAGHMLWVGAV